MKLQFNSTSPIVADRGVIQGQSTEYGDLLVSDSALYKNVTQSTLVTTGPGFLIGVIINNHTNGTMRLWDNTVASTTPITGVITFSAVATTGERFIPFYGAFFSTGLYASVNGADITILYN